MFKMLELFVGIYMQGIWILPLQVVMAFIILHQILGLTTFLGLAASLVVMLPNLPVIKLQQEISKQNHGIKRQKHEGHLGDIKN